MLRHFLIGSIVLSGLVSVPATHVNAAMRTVVEDDKEICYRQSDGSWKCKDKKSAVLICNPDLVCTESGEPLPKGTTIKPGMLSIVPRSDRGNPKPSTIDDRQARNCRFVDKKRDPGCTITSPHPLAVQDPSVPDGKDERIFPGLPPAPKYSLVAQVTPDKCPSGVVLVDENGKLVCG